MAQRVERDKAEAEEGDNLVNRQVISGRSPQIPGMGGSVSSRVSNMLSEGGLKKVVFVAKTVSESRRITVAAEDDGADGREGRENLNGAWSSRPRRFPGN